MKKFLGFLFVIFLILTGCDNYSFHHNDKIKVGIETSEDFSTDKQIKEIEKGDNVSFEIMFKDNLSFVSASYKNNELSNISNNFFTITFKNILYPVMISLSFEEVDEDNVITYYSGLDFSKPIKIKKTGTE